MLSQLFFIVLIKECEVKPGLFESMANHKVWSYESFLNITFSKHLRK